ncbi:MAG TPA: hypothetical protein VFN88_02250, partial [Caulobacteraceae bacterium]|nr:hypothetical protein [Caulobacteraceae bacterium]
SVRLEDYTGTLRRSADYTEAQPDLRAQGKVHAFILRHLADLIEKGPTKPRGGGGGFTPFVIKGGLDD